MLSQMYFKLYFQQSLIQLIDFLIIFHNLISSLNVHYLFFHSLLLIFESNLGFINKIMIINL